MNLEILIIILFTQMISGMFYIMVSSDYGIIKSIL